MEYVKEDYLLGNKKIIVGDRLHDLVLENLGKIYIRYGSSYKEFNSIINSLNKATGTASIKLEEGTLSEASTYGNGTLVYCVKTDSLYLVYNNEFLTLAEAVTTKSSKYVQKTGDTMTGQLVIACKGAPLKVQSTDLVENLNANYLAGNKAEDFTKSQQDENITGNWTFAGETTFDKEAEFNGEAEFNAKAEFNKTATFSVTDGSAAIKIDTGDIITEGSIGSKQYASGMTGYGWRLDANTNTLEIDNLIVRGVLNVFELVVNKVSATNGSLWITDSFKVKIVHDLEYLEVNNDLTVSKINTLSTEKYYIPYTIPETVHIYTEVDSFENTIFPETKAYNYCLINVNKTSYPNRDGSNITAEEESETFFRFHFMFKILDKEAFLSAIRGKYTTVIEHYEDEGYIFHYDTLNYLRDADDNYYELIYNSETDTYDLQVIASENLETASKARRTNVEGALYSRGETHMEYLSDYDQMLALAQQNVIEKINLYQKYPESAEDYEIVDSSESSSAIIDPEFDKHYYSIITADKVKLDKDYGYYAKEDTIRRVNLYYKYFGERMVVSDNNYSFPETKGLYIVEAENGEYPVFHSGDILRCQKFQSTSVKQYNAVVLGTVGAYGFVIQLQQNGILNQIMAYNYDEEGNLMDSSDAVTSTDSAVSQTDTTLYAKSGTLQKRLDENDGQSTEEIVEDDTASYPQEKDAIVRIGSLLDVDRQNSMLLTSSENYSPFTDVLVGINRPDYSVIYFTPKYKKFVKSVTSGSSNVEKSFYIQNDKFGAIMELGNLGWDNADQDLKDSIILGLTEDTWTNTYLPIYTKYKDISTVCSVPEVDRKNTNSLTKPVKVSLTYQENEDTPIYYDEEGNRIRVSVEETYTDYLGETQTETVKYYTSSKEDRTVITSYSSGLSGKLDYINEGTVLTLSVGSLVNPIASDDTYDAYDVFTTNVQDTIYINNALLSSIQITPEIYLATYNADGTTASVNAIAKEESVTVQLKVEYASSAKVYNLTYGQTYDLLSDLLVTESSYPQKLKLHWVFSYQNQNLEYFNEIQILPHSVYTAFNRNSNTVKTTTIDVYSGKAYVDKWGCLEITNDFDEILKVPITSDSGETEYHYAAELIPTCKTRMGNLGGIYNETFGTKQPKGYGFYGENVYLTGNFYLDNGRSLVDISDDVLLAVGSTNKIKEDLEALTDSVNTNIELLKNDQAALKSGLNSTIKNYISTNKNSVLKIGLDYSLWALGNAGLSLINPDATYSYDATTGNYNVDEATVGDGDEYLALQGNSIYFNINKSSGDYYYVVCTLTDPNTWVYKESSIYVPYDATGALVKFFLGCVSQSVLKTSVAYQVQTTSTNKEFLRYVGLPTDLNSPTSENVSGDTEGEAPKNTNTQSYSFSRYYINTKTDTSTNNIQYLTTDGEYADYYTLNTSTSTVYFVQKVDTVGLFDESGNFNTNLIQLNTLIAIEQGHTLNPDFVVDNAVSLLDGSVNYPVVDANGNADTTVPYVIISGTSGLLSANRANLSGSIKIGDYYSTEGDYIYLTDNAVESDRLTNATTPALYLIDRKAGLNTITASFSSETITNPLAAFEEVDLEVKENASVSINQSFTYNLNYYTKNFDFVGRYSNSQKDKYTEHTGKISNAATTKYFNYTQSDGSQGFGIKEPANIMSDGTNKFTLAAGTQVTLTISYTVTLKTSTSNEAYSAHNYVIGGLVIRDASDKYVWAENQEIAGDRSVYYGVTYYSVNDTYIYYLQSYAEGGNSGSLTKHVTTRCKIANTSAEEKTYSWYIQLSGFYECSECIEDHCLVQPTYAKGDYTMGDPYDYRGYDLVDASGNRVYATTNSSFWQQVTELSPTKDISVQANYSNITITAEINQYSAQIFGNGALFGYNNTNYFTTYAFVNKNSTQATNDSMIVQYAADGYGQKFEKGNYYNIVAGNLMPKYFPILTGQFSFLNIDNEALMYVFNGYAITYPHKISTATSSGTHEQIKGFKYRNITDTAFALKSQEDSIYFEYHEDSGIYIMRPDAGIIVIALTDKWKDLFPKGLSSTNTQVHITVNGIQTVENQVPQKQYYRWGYGSLSTIQTYDSPVTATITSPNSSSEVTFSHLIQIAIADDETLNDGTFYLEVNYCPNS